MNPLQRELRAMLPGYIWDALNAAGTGYADEHEVEVDLVVCDQNDVLSFVVHYPDGPRRLATIHGEGACEGIGAVLIPGEMARNTSAVCLLVFQALRVARLEMQQRDEIYVNAAKRAIEGGTPEEADRAAFNAKNEPWLRWRERVGLLRLYEERTR